MVVCELREEVTHTQPAPKITAAATGPLLDFRQLKPLAAIGIVDFRDLLNDVVEDVPAHLDKIRAAIQADDAPELQARAHTFRGMIANYGCIALAERLTRLEYQDQVIPAQAATIHAELQDLWDRSLAAIEVWEKSVPEFATR